jgi:hypothetical protein
MNMRKITLTELARIDGTLDASDMAIEVKIIVDVLKAAVEPNEMNAVESLCIAAHERAQDLLRRIVDTADKAADETDETDEADEDGDRCLVCGATL